MGAGAYSSGIAQSRSRAIQPPKPSPAVEQAKGRANTQEVSIGTAQGKPPGASSASPTPNKTPKHNCGHSPRSASDIGTRWLARLGASQATRRPQASPARKRD